MEDGEHYALSARLTPITIADKTLVLQFSVKYDPSPDCQKGYIKLYDCNFEPSKLYHDTPYFLRFGSQDCGTRSFGLRAEGLWGQDTMLREVEYSAGKYTHLYTLILRPNQSYEFLVDGKTPFTKSDNLAEIEYQIHIAQQNLFGNITSVYPNICGIGFELYHVYSGIIFDNILLSDDVQVAKCRREDILGEMTQWTSGGTSLLVDITTEDLTRLLNCNTSIEYKEDNRTTIFLEDFDKFLVPFNWTGNNSVIMATAKYNRFSCASSVTTQLWVSFQPQQVDILDDVDSVLQIINEANSIAPNTVTTIVISYGFLQLDNQTWPFLNHEIRKVSKKIRSLPDQAPKLGLQISDINCRGKREYSKYLEANLLDFLVLMPMPQTKQFIGAGNSDKILESCVLSAGLIDMPVAPLIHSYESVEIDFEKSVYSYNRDVENQLIGSYINAFTLIRAGDKTSKKDIIDTTGHRPKSKNLANWLYQPTNFNKAHFGAVISWRDLKLMGSANFASTILASFGHIMIDISNHDNVEAEDYLHPILEEMARYSLLMKNQTSGGNHIPKENAQLRISILVTIESHDFEVNKRQADRVISAAWKGNAICTKCVDKIFFDLLACSRSDICSGSDHNENNLTQNCLHAERISDFSIVMEYTWRAQLQKRERQFLVRPGRMEDAQFDEMKRDNSNKKCTSYVYSFDRMPYLLCKSILYHQDIVNHGGLKASKIVIESFSFCRYSSKTDSHFAVNFYVNVVGCVGGHSNMTLLVEYATMMEDLNRWAIAEDIVLFINAGAETPSKCSENVQFPKNEGCKCGWWIKQESNYSYQDKKSVARQLYEIAEGIAITDNVKKRTVVSPESLLWLWILIPVNIFGVLITIPAIFLIFHYRSKQILTKQEVEEFIKGRLTTRAESVQEGGEAAETQAYNSEKYELSPTTFTIDTTSSCLGSGENGRACRGSISRDDAIIVSAVKMANTSVRKSHGYYWALKGLLSEIKILAYVGEHNHIVSLLGAYTKNVRKGEIAVFLELCQFGSLDKYLHSVKPQIIESNVSCNVQASDSDAYCVDEEENERVKIQVLDKESSDELWRWAGEIASGMEFLASKKLVHADLATRNVLLTAQKIIKISDFGLSRRLYDYTEYVKQNQAPLPWRWMPPESLCRSIFNEKTDIWAFGVTLWEMFTLGDQPYPGLSWAANFTALLERGLRLPEPRFNLNEIYSVMLRCWDINPSMRPSFSQLKSELSIATSD